MGGAAGPLRGIPLKPLNTLQNAGGESSASLNFRWDLMGDMTGYPRPFCLQLFDGGLLPAQLLPPLPGLLHRNGGIPLLRKNGFRLDSGGSTFTAVHGNRPHGASATAMAGASGGGKQGRDAGEKGTFGRQNFPLSWTVHKSIVEIVTGN